MVSSAVHGADAERLDVLSKVLPGSELGASLIRIIIVNTYVIISYQSISKIKAEGINMNNAITIITAH